MPAHPPPPGPIVAPDVSAIENAVRHITFPISKREMIERIDEGDTVVLGGRNVDLRELVRDIPDDHFESADEFHDALEVLYGDRPPAEAHMLPFPPMGFPEEMARGAPGASDQPALPEDNA